jgi:hypothetical protein
MAAAVRNILDTTLYLFVTDISVQCQFLHQDRADWTETPTWQTSSKPTYTVQQPQTSEAEILHILVLFRVVYLSVYYFTQKIISLKFIK